MSSPIASGQKVAEIAKLWLGTPYHHMGRVRGAGADCAMMPLEVYTEAGILPRSDVQFYPLSWAVHREREVYLEWIEAVIKGTDVREAAPPPERTPLPGDFLVFKFARTYSHGAIVIEWPLCIHAHIRCGVVYVDALQNPALAEKIAGGLVKCFTLATGADDAEVANVR